MNKKIKQRCAAINVYIHAQKAAMLDDLKQIVEINSPSEYAEGNTSVGDFLEELMTDLNINIKRIENGDFGKNLYAESIGTEKPTIFFCGHTDTVFPLGTEWPFSVEGGRAYGPGVIDMKSGLVTVIYALKALKETGEMPISMKIFFNTDEEEGSPESRQLIPELINGVDFAYILEPAEPDGKVIIRRKGIAKFEVFVTGLAAHAGKSPETGINANLELAHQVIEVEKLACKQTGTTMNAGVLEGGTSAFIIPESAHAIVESRVLTFDEQYRVEKGMHALTGNNFVKGTDIKVSGGFHRPPLLELPNTKYLKDALIMAAEKMDLSISFGISGAASDGNNISALGIPVIDGMGPVGGREHSHDEYLEIESLYERTQLLACSLLHLSESFTTKQD